MKAKIRKGGYSATIAKQYIDEKQPVQCISTECEPQMKFEDGQPTGEVNAYKAWFIQKGLAPFQVKFDIEITLPPYLSIVSFENLEACEVGYNVYFRATSIKEVK